MSRITPRSTSALLSSLRARLGLTHSHHARNRLLHTSSSSSSSSSIQTTTTGTALSDAKGTAATAPKRQRRKQEQLDSTSIDSISKSLIKDLYTRPSSSKSKVTLEDVLALKPAQRTVTPDEFNKLKDLVAASFNLTQLKDVLRSQGNPANGKKSVLINQIMLLMDLEVVKPESNDPPLVEDPYQAERNFESEIFASNRRELFFILGAEGNSLRQLEKDKNVRLSISIADETYTIRGEKASIQEAKERIQDMIAVTEESWDVSGYKEKDLVMKDPSALEDIARRSETFVSAGDDNVLIIAGRSDRNMEEAKRLFDLKVQQPHSKDGLTFYYQQDILAPLGMLPVYDSVTMSADENKKSFFRICQTVLYAPKPAERSEGAIYPVRSSPGTIGTMDALGQHLKETFDETLLPSQSLDVSVQFGQVLYPNENKLLTRVPKATSFDSLELKQWLATAQDPYFFQNIPFFKAVSTLPLVEPKIRTIEVEYTPSSRTQETLGDQRSTRVIFELNNEGELCIQEGRSIDRQLLTNIMVLDQPMDLQIRSEISTQLPPDSTAMRALLAQTTLPFANRLDCPAFFSFSDDIHISSTPAVAQVGLGSTAAPTHTLKSILMKTTGVFQHYGFPLVATDINDQYGQVRRQELKLLPIPLRYITGKHASAPKPHFIDNWNLFMKASMHLQKLF
ncbi:hypothetical protein BG015_007581 [Linnemannia schmuckeri]|uniref:SAP domain-containing protein n=1 Tax=Linnemannia schmuckeri TaxID=64567 RepID=A0A9P5S7F6_9FUNG|nr:hypothetical protein BG015_007581 [Linnemannia schmuckeri]